MYNMIVITGPTATGKTALGVAVAKALGGEFDIQIDCDQFKACLVFPQ